MTKGRMTTQLIGAVLLLLGLLVPVMLPVAQAAPDSDAPPRALWLMTLDGVVGPATADYVTRGLHQAAEGDARAVLLKINTPDWINPCGR